MNDRDIQNNNEELLVHRFPSQAKFLGETRAKARTTLTQCGCSSDITENIVLAIDEACQNVIRHAYGKETEKEIVLQIQRQENVLTITLRDFAPPVGSDCMKLRALEDIRPGGLGCHFIQLVMEDISVEPAADGEGNILRMVKQIS